MVAINKTVLMSGAEYFDDNDASNVLMDPEVPVDVKQAIVEHNHIREAIEAAGVKVVKVDAPLDCEDGVYTANWALVRGGKALMARLPKTRAHEEPFALEAVRAQGLTPIVLPPEVERFSGQGDALPCGDIVFTQSPFRTTMSAHPYLKSELGFRDVVALETLPAYDSTGNAVINKNTGWEDSPTYDIDLAIAVLKWPAEGQKGLIAWCPDVFKPESQAVMRAYDGVDKIEVSRDEAMNAFALNLLSTGETVIMNSHAPVFQAALEAHGLKTVALDLPELRKGGGSIRCTTLTLDN